MLMKAVEARKKAEVVHMHTTECRNTHIHMATAIKGAKSLFSQWIPAVSPSVAHVPFFFSCTHTELKDSGPQALFLGMRSNIRAEF